MPNIGPSLSIADWRTLDCGLGCADGELLVCCVQLWRTSSPTYDNVIGGAVGANPCGVAFSFGVSYFCWKRRNERRNEVGRYLDSFLWVHWAFVRDWEIEDFGSWLEVLPEYLPRLGLERLLYALDTLPAPQKFQNETHLPR
jgi:hypothetical protein